MVQIYDKKDCCGCNACVQSCPKDCITMHEDNEGFLYPSINLETCIDCGLCEKVCPEINQGEERMPLHVYAAKNKNEEIRLQSSSGGIFTLLAEKIIEEQGIVFGARFDENWDVVHDFTETIEGLVAFRGSKYVQSRIGETFSQAKQFLKSGRKVLFSGTPCQITGLKLFLHNDYANLLTVDIVCHGVPSPKIWQLYLQEFRVKNKEKENTITFRDKSTGWKSYSFKINYETKIFKELGANNLFMKGFLKDLYLRPSCYDCPSKSFKSRSDITLGDYWGIQNFLPNFDDDKGVGLIMINSPKGQKEYDKIQAETVETEYIQALKENLCIEKSVIMPSKRVTFFDGINNKSLLQSIKKQTKDTWPIRMRKFVHKALRIFKLN